MTNSGTSVKAGLSRRLILGAPALLALTASRATAQASTLRLVVPFSAGTNVDTMARRFAEAVAPLVGERPVIVNRDGGAGTVAFAELAQREADGATFLFTPAGPLVVHPHLAREPRLDPAAFQPVCQVYEQDLVLITSRKLAVESLEGLLAEAKRRPGDLKFGHYGPASATHIELLAFSRATGIRVIAVPYRAHGQLMADLASGALDAALTTPGTFDPTVLRPVALVAEEPLALYPGLPTTVSLGHRPQARVFGGLIARSGTPAPVIEQMETAFRTAFDDATFQAMAARMGARPRFVGAQAFAARINEERLQMQALLKSLGLIG
jgi:tripartite-type tricarboxylate transporter receptor subunit TctC